MKASQYMYTSWKNAPNHGFSLYSMTPGLSPTDCEEISKMMKYTLQPGMPRDPSDEQIEQLLPRNVSFFKLSSGKYCLAQAGYVGREYRGFEDGGRLGNYLIHAYVIDDIEDMVPMSFVGDSIFRWDLTKEEWTTSRPDPLPVVEIPSVGRMLAPNEINSFFNEDRTATLEKLIEATISANAEGKTVFFNDENKNMPYWYKALAVCLPPNLAGRAQFNTYSLSAMAPVGMSPSCKLCLVNVSASLEGAAIPVTPPSFTEETRKGNVILDLVRKVYSDVKVNSYARIVTQKFKASIYDAINYAKKIDSIVAKYSCSTEKAVDIDCFAEGKFEHFATFEHVVATLKLIGGSADSQMQRSISALSERILSGAYPFSSELASVIKSVIYPAVSAEIKAKFVNYCLNAALASCPQTDKAAYVSSVNALMPCAPEITADYVFASGLYKSLVNGDECGGYFLMSIIAANYGTLASRYPGVADKIVHYLLSRYIASGDVRSLDKLYDINPERMSAFFAASLKQDIDGGELVNIGADTMFYLLTKSRAGLAEAVRALVAAIRAWGADNSFMEKYDAFVKGAPELDSALRKMPEHDSFFEGMEVCRFSKSRVSPDGLSRYYERIYTKRVGDRVFVIKLNEYMNALDAKARFDTALAFYAKWLKNKSELTAADKVILEVLYPSVLTKLSKKEIIAMLGDPTAKKNLKLFIEAVEAAGVTTDANYRATKCYIAMSELSPAEIASKAKDGELLADIAKDSRAMAIFTAELFGNYIALVYDAVKQSRADAICLVNALLVFASNTDGFEKALAEAYSSKDKNVLKAAETVVGSLLVYVATRVEKTNPVSVAYYGFLKSIPKKDRLVIGQSVKKLTKSNDDLLKCMEIINEINAQTKEGFFDKLKGLFGKNN